MVDGEALFSFFNQSPLLIIITVIHLNQKGGSPGPEWVPFLNVSSSCSTRLYALVAIQKPQYATTCGPAAMRAKLSIVDIQVP